MISDHVDQETIVEKSFAVANAFSKTNSGLPNKSKRTRAAHRKKIEEDLVASKQKVVKHVLESRALEKAKVQAKLIEQALRLRVEKSLGLHGGRYARYIQWIHSGRFRFELDEEAVYHIEIASKMSFAGIGKIIYDTYILYSDSGLVLKLNSLKLSPDMITEEFFYRVCKASSGGTISEQDANKLFQRATYVAQELMDSPVTSVNKHGIDDKSESESVASIDEQEETLYSLRWKLLKALLRRKMLLLKLTMEVMLSPEYKFYAASVLSPAVKSLYAAAEEAVSGTLSLPLTAPASQTHTRSGTAESHVPAAITAAAGTDYAAEGSYAAMASTSSAISRRGRSREEAPQPPSSAATTMMMMSQSMSTLDITGMLPTSAGSESSNGYALVSPGRIRHRDVLTASLERSRTRQSDLTNKIQDSILSMYGGDVVPIDAIRGNATALNAFRSIACERMLGAWQAVHKRFLRKMLVRWHQASTRFNVESECVAYLKVTSAYRMLQILELSCAKSLHRAMLNLKEFVRLHREHEYWGAVSTLQRHWRGALGRHYAKTINKHNATTRIQNQIRMFISRGVLREKQRIQVLKTYVAMIERRWKSHSWNRTLKRIFHLQFMIRKAKLIQRTYRGYRGRVRYHVFFMQRLRYRNAVKFQSLWRRYKAVIRMEQIRIHHTGQKSAVFIQTQFRAYIARARVRAMRLHYQSAIAIQYLCLRGMAIKKTHRRRRIRAAIRIQRIIRGHLGRIRYSLMKQNKLDEHAAYWRAVAVIAPVLFGYATRRRLAEPVRIHKERRNYAAYELQRHFVAIMLGQKARVRVNGIREANYRADLERRMAIRMQRLARGIAGRQLAMQQREIVERQRELANRIPYYYRMKNEYYLTQNMYHRPFVVKIQCMVRQRIARNRIHRRILDIAAAKIQREIRGFLDIKHAKMKLVELRVEKRKMMERTVTAINVVMRCIRRYEAKKNRKAEMIKWFLGEIGVCIKLQKGLLNFRAMKREEVIMHKASTNIQKIVRGQQAKQYVRRNRKKLLRVKAVRKMEKRNQMALVIQCCVRVYRARQRTQKQRQLREEAERERREFEELELSLEGLHEDFMKELLHIRAQRGARALLAKTKFIQKVAEHKAALEKKAETEKADAARCIQALLRGVIGRRKFREDLPQLKKAHKARTYCFECEQRVATRRCRQCKDKFCIPCYDRIHQKGNRKSHSWVNIKVDVRAVSAGKGSRGSVSFGGLDASSTQAVNPAQIRAQKRSEWQEFYDESARAKYWFNQVTGEASWTQPN